MSEYDAFGRKTDDNPLEQAGSVPSATPVPGPPTPPPRSGRPRAFAVTALVAGIFVVGSMAASAVLLAGGGEDTEGGLSEPAVVDEGGAPSAPADDGYAPPPAEEGDGSGDAAPATPPARDPRGLEPGSMIRRAELARAIRALRSGDLGRPVSFRVAPERIDVQLKTGDGRLRSVQVRSDGEPRELNLSGAGFSHVPAMAWSDVDPQAPERMVRAAAERASRPASDVDYLVLMGLGKPTWGLFFKGGTHFQGDAAGRITRRVSP